MTVVNDSSAGSSRLGEYRQKKLYRAVRPILTSTGLVRVPCGVCQVRFTQVMQTYESRPLSTQENKHGIGPNRNKIEPTHGLSVSIFLFQFEPVIRCLFS